MTLSFFQPSRTKGPEDSPILPMSRLDRRLTDLNYSHTTHKPTQDEIGNVYDDERFNERQKEWEGDLKGEYEYFLRVRDLSRSRPHLRPLVEFMGNSTTEARVREDQEACAKSQKAKATPDRRNKINVHFLEFNSGGTVAETVCTSRTGLLEALKHATKVDASAKFRLFVVEDLSLEVIDSLGEKLRIPADFFRAHILDFAWHNSESAYREQPSLDIFNRQQNWFCVRFPRARYYDSVDSRKKAFNEAKKFNVIREPRDDGNVNMVWDKTHARVLLTRSKATFWIRPAAENLPTTAVLLLDPTVSMGHRLWRYYPNWGNQDESTEAGSSEGSLFEEFIRRVKTPHCFDPRCEPCRGDPGLHNTSSALLQTVMAEWLTVADLLKTRLYQTEWELAYPKRFHPGGIEATISRLSALRRFIPSYHEMISETLLQVFRALPSDGSGFFSRTPPSHTASGPDEALHKKLGISDYQLDFQLLANRLTLYQQHTDRLVQAATAAISIEDTRRSIKQNKNLQILTYTVTPFIPMSFVAAIFSMQENVSALRDTMILFAEVAVPIAVLAISLIVMLDPSWLKNLWLKAKAWKEEGHFFGSGPNIPEQKRDPAPPGSFLGSVPDQSPRQPGVALEKKAPQIGRSSFGRVLEVQEQEADAEPSSCGQIP